MQHWSKDFHHKGQKIFIFSVELVSVVKPRNLKSATEAVASPFREVGSPVQSDGSAEDEEDFSSYVSASTDPML